MAWKRWLLAAATLIPLTGAGCASCQYEACKPLLDVGPKCDIPIAARREVYVYLVNGATPGHLSGLRDKLFEAGYSKISYGQVVHAIGMGMDMRKVHKNDPEARFVLVGYDLGAPIAVILAKDAIADGLPVDAVVLLDPPVKTAEAKTGTKKLIILSGTTEAATLETLSVPEAGHFTLPIHPQTVEAVTSLLADVAGKIPTPIHSVHLDWNYEFAPEQREFPAPDPKSDPAWNFLFDHPGGTTEPLTPADADLPAKQGKVISKP